MPETLQNVKRTQVYTQLVKELHAGPKDKEILGSFITNVCGPSLTFRTAPQEKEKNERRKNGRDAQQRSQRDVEEFTEVK